MTPLDEYELGELLGAIRTDVAAIKATLGTWESRCQLCRERFDDRLRACEQAQTRIITIGATVGLLAGLVPNWLRELWR